MSEIATILPPISTALERAADRAVAARHAALPSTVPSIWNADTCPPVLLPFLAIAVSVDEWDEGWSVDKKRAAIREAPEIRRRKGTPSAIRRALTALGQADAEIIERSDHIRCDGSVSCDGTHSCGGRWATYQIRTFQPMTVSMAMLAKRLMNAIGRNSVHLLKINYAESAFRCDGTIICNGDYSCGAVNTAIY